MEKDVWIVHRTCYAGGNRWNGLPHYPHDQVMGVYLRKERAEEVAEGLTIHLNALSGETRDEVGWVQRTKLEE